MNLFARNSHSKHWIDIKVPLTQVDEGGFPISEVYLSITAIPKICFEGSGDSRIVWLERLPKLAALPPFRYRNISVLVRQTLSASQCFYSNPDGYISVEIRFV